MSITRIFDAHVTPDALRVSGTSTAGALTLERGHTYAFCQFGLTSTVALTAAIVPSGQSAPAPLTENLVTGGAAGDAPDATYETLADAPGLVASYHVLVADGTVARVTRLAYESAVCFGGGAGFLKLAVPAAAPWAAAGTAVVVGAGHGGGATPSVALQRCDIVAAVPRLSPGDYAWCEVELQVRGSVSLPWVPVSDRGSVTSDDMRRVLVALDRVQDVGAASDQGVL